MKTSVVDSIVAGLFIVIGALAMYDSLGQGAGWGEDGPQSGYFPFYVALLMTSASLVTLVRAARTGSREIFVDTDSLKRVLSVFVPCCIFVAAIPFLGLYVAGGLFIAFFMVFLGRYLLWRAVVVGALIPIVFFVIFEIWFLVPLPKGPLEAALGF